jgi:hypothetical protein
VTFVVNLNTNATSHVTANSLFDEALMLVDEPNTLEAGAQRSLLNCGQTGATDNGPSGPGVCEIISTGNPALTYDGHTNVRGTGICAATAPTMYGCGRPNAFQGRLGAAAATAQSNGITFLDVPFDPPGAGVRELRITNLRGDAVLLGPNEQIRATIEVVSGAFAPISNPTQILSYDYPGLTASIPGPGKVQVTEGFANAWRDRNVAFTVGNGLPGNAVYTPPWTFDGNANYPPQAAQNVPGSFYNTEDMFQWQPPVLNGPPSPNPPPSFGLGPVVNLGDALDSLASGGVNTGISVAGVSTQGTRIALSFSSVPKNDVVVCSTRVALQHSGTTTPDTGVLVMTTTDANGAGPFTTIASGIGSSNTNLVVYEVLYADPFGLEYADIPCYLTTVSGTSALPAAITVTPGLAPFYSTASAGRPTPTAADPTPVAIPRFTPGTISYGVMLGAPIS